MTQTKGVRVGWFPWMTLGGVVAVMTPAIMLAAGGEGTGFNAVVHGIESRYHAHANHIPFMMLISGVAGIATHGGVRGLRVAEIEHLDGPVDGAELHALVEQRVGKGWERIVRETSRDGDDQTLIYAKPDGDRMGMLVVSLDHHEMNVVQISVNPDHLDDDIKQFSHRHDRDRADHAAKPEGDEQDDGDSE